MEKKESKPQPKRRGRKPKAKSEGLGDTIEKVTKATGIKKVVEVFSKATGLDCGCDARKEKLNEIFSYNKRKKPIECMTKDHHDLWTSIKDIKKSDKSEYIGKVYPAIATIHADIYGHRYHEPCTCSPKQWDNWRADIELIYSTYEDASK